MKVNDTVRQGMFNYPSIYPTKFDALEHMFAVNGNGYDWNSKGQLVCPRYRGQAPLKKEMDYSDLDERKTRYETQLAENAKLYPESADTDITHLFLAEIEAERMQRDFTVKYIDLILQHTCSRRPFGRGSPRLKTYMTIKHVCYTYANIFNYPENITKDWAKAMEDFIGCWLVALNNEYGIGGEWNEKYDSEKAMGHWPDEAKTLYKRLQVIREDLLNKITGTTPEQRKARIDKIIEALKKD